MLNISQPVKFPQFQKIAEPLPMMSSEHHSDEATFKTIKQQSVFLSRKKRSGDAMDVDREVYSRPYSDQLIWDNELQLIWYGDNKREEIKHYQGTFKEKMQAFLQSSINKFPEISENWLTEKAYPTDYELGYLSWLACKDEGYEILASLPNELEVRQEQIVTQLKNLEERLGSGSSTRHQRNYENERRALLDEQSELLKKRRLVSWKLLGIALHPAINNGYVGVVYWHASKRHIVIAHRGTKPKNLGADWADLKGIIMNKKVAQMDSATTFSYLILESLPEEIKSISFTGHSLGGWLAQITTFSSEYLERSGNFFKKRAQPIYHPHTVVFDSPGCQPMLSKLKRSFDLRYTINKPQLDVHALDIQVYLSAPNMVNTLNAHVGIIYRLFPKLQSNLDKAVAEDISKFSHFKHLVENYLTNESFMYTVRTHKIGGMLNVWPKNEDRPTREEVQRVQDWPIASNLMANQEYKLFFTRAEKLNNYHITDESTVTQFGFRIRYRTSVVDLSSASMNIFNPEERQFLYAIKILQDWFIEQKGHLEFELHELTELHHFFQDKKLDVVVVASIMHAFQAYTLVDHGNRLKTRDPQERIAPLINRFKQLLRFYPGIQNVVKQEMEKRPILLQAIYASESDRWISTLRNQVDLRWQINRDRLNLVSFLTDKEARVLHIVVDSEEMKLVSSQLGYDVLAAIGEKEASFFQQFSNEEKIALEPYAHSNIVTFLNSEQVCLQQSRGFNINDFFKNKNSPSLLWLDGELNDVDVWQNDLFNENLEKKFIVVTKKESRFFYFLENKTWKPGEYHIFHSKKLGWFDLTIESKQHVLERVTVQKENNLARLIGIESLSDITGEKEIELEKILDKTLIQLINNRIDIGSLPERFSDLEAAYSESQGEVLTSKLKSILLEDFLTEETTRYLIISGLFNPDISVSKDKLVQYIGLSDVNIEAIKNKVDFYDIPQPGNKRIFIANDKFSGRDFRKFCSGYNPSELRVDWIHWENSHFILKDAYDPRFYIKRKFYYKNEIIIDNNIKRNEVSVQIEDDLFIFSDVTFDKRLRFITSLKKILQPFIPTMNDYVLEKFKENEEVKIISVTLASKNSEALLKNFNQMGSVHWLKQDDSSHLIWQRSVGNLESLYGYIDEIRTHNAQELLSEKDFIKKVNNKAALIIDEPGMGKTTVLTELARSMLGSNWVIRVNLRSCEEAIERLASVGKFTLDDAVEFLSVMGHAGLGSDLAKNLLRYKLQYPTEGLPLLLLFDGFDEVKTNKKGKISSLLNFLQDKATVWVTSRKHEIKILLNSLLVFDSQLKELDLGEQEEFLKRFWHSKLFLTLPQSEGVFERKYKIYVESLLREVNIAFRLEGSRFMGIPLQLRLIGEGFKEKFKEFVNDETSSIAKLGDISVLGLYKQFIHARYHLFLEREGIPRQNFVQDATIVSINKMYRRLALYKLFGDGIEVSEFIGIKSPFVKGEMEYKVKTDKKALEYLFRVGLIQAVEEDQFEFIHKSFAEYFVADFLISQLTKVPYHHNQNRVQKILLTNILIKSEYQLIRIFFNEQLAKGISFSPGTLSGFSDREEFLNEQGQTAFHIAVEEQHQEVFKYLLHIFKANLKELIDFVSVRDWKGETALYLALKQNKHEYVRQFIEIIKDCPDDIKEIFLLSTMFRMDEDDSDLLIKKLMDDYIEPYPEIKKIASGIKRDWELIRHFLEAAEDGTLNIANYWSNHFSLNESKKTYLLFATNKYRATALHLAIMGDHKNVVEMLLAQGASGMINIEARYEIFSIQKDSTVQYEIKPVQDDMLSLQHGITPLQIAVSKNQKDIAANLLAAGAKVNVGPSERAPLYMAATLDNDDIVRDILLYDADVNVQVSTGEAPLYWATFHDNQRMVDVLLANYADVNIQTDDGYTPLYWAVSHNNKIMVEQLLEVDAEINVGHDDTIPLYIAVRNNEPSIVHLLLDQGAIPGIRDAKGRTLLLIAIRDNLKTTLDNDAYEQDIENIRNIVEWLLTYGIDINAAQDGETPLYWAARHGDELIAEMLLEWGADVNMQLQNGETPLYWAIKNNKPSLVNKLLKAGAIANIEVKDNSIRHTPLSVARENQNTEIESMLLREGAQDNVKRDIRYQLFFAIRTNDNVSMERLLPGININTVMYGGKKLLHWALIYGRYKIAKTLLYNGANISRAKSNDDVALYLTIKHGFNDPVKASEIIEMLLDRNANINMKLRNGEPLLCWAINRSHFYRNTLFFVMQLLERNPDVNLRSEDNKTALYLAIRYNFFDVIDILLSRDVDVNVKLLNGETPLYWAVKNNLEVVVDKLLARGADVNVKLSNGETLLYWAVFRNSFSMLEKLLKHGANFDEKVMDKTLFVWAKCFKHKALAEILKEIGVRRQFFYDLKRPFEDAEDNAEDRKRRASHQSLKPCLPSSSGYHPSDRGKREVPEKNCQFSWDDVDEFNEEKEKPREFSEIKINSDKFLDVLKNPSLSETQRAQLFELAKQVTVIGKSKERIDELIQHQRVLKYWEKIGRVAGLATYGMMAKNMLKDFLQEDYEGVAINVGFIMGGQGLARVAEATSIKGAEFVSSGQRLLGQSLRIASPFLARGTSAFIAYDLYNQINAYQKGVPGAAVGMVGDGIYLGVDGIEIGIELAEIAGLLEGVSSVTGPIGASIGAIVFIGTDVYLAVKQASQIDKLIHLTSTEKFIEGIRAFVGMNPEQHVERLLREKQGNTQLFNQAISFLKKNSNICRYILPTMKEKVVCIPKRRTPADFLSRLNSPLNSPRIGVSNLQLENCNIQLEMNLDNNIVLDNKRKDIKWSRIKPDVTEGNLFCAPLGNDLEIPSEGAYLCSQAMGIEWHDARTGNITFIELGDGSDVVIGFSQGNHIVKLGNGYKIVALGDGDDIFLLTGNLLSGSVLHGGDGINTLDLAPHVQLFEALNATVQVHNYLLRENESDYVASVACSTHYIDGRGGKDDDHGKDIIIISDACAYDLKVAVRSHTRIQNYSGNPNNQFIYLIPTTTNKGDAIISLENSEGSNQFVFAYGLSDIYRMVKVNYTEYSAIEFTFKQNVTDTSVGDKYRFTVYIHYMDKNKLSFVLNDNTLIKVVNNKFFAFQSTNNSLESIIKYYPSIAEHLNLFIVAYSTLRNESILIGNGNHDVISNDPSHRSHLIGNGGENIFIVRSGYEILDRRKLPIPEIVLYDKDNRNLIDTLDLREIKNQLEEQLGVEVKVRARLVANTNDIVIELFFSTEPEEAKVSIRLDSAFVTHWYKRLRIIMNHAPMELDVVDLRLRPRPLVFGSDIEIMVIRSEDIEENTEIIIDKKSDHYRFFRLNNDVIMTNVLHDNLQDSECYALILKNFYQVPTLQTLSTLFRDKKIVLKDEMEKIANASNFMSECDQYNRTWYEMLFHDNVTEKGTSTIFPLIAQDLRVQRPEPQRILEKKEMNKSIWSRVAENAVYLLSFIGTVSPIAWFGYRYGMRNRLRAEAMSVAQQAAAVAAPLLVSPVQAECGQSFAIQELDCVGRDKSDTARNNINAEFDGCVAVNYPIVKWILYQLGFHDTVARLNKAEQVVNTSDSMDSMSSLALAEQQVSKALRSYDLLNGTTCLEDMRLFRDKNATVVTKSNHAVVGRKKGLTLFQPMPVSPSTANDSSIAHYPLIGRK